MGKCISKTCVEIFISPESDEIIAAKAANYKFFKNDKTIMIKNNHS